MKKRISKNINNFSNFINALKKEKRKKNFFWIDFDLKPISKKQRSRFSNSFFDIKSKSKFQKVLSFFNFVYKIEKWKMEKFSKFGILPVHRLTLNQNWKQMPN